MVVLILDGLVDERVWPEEVACNANRLLKYFPEQRDADVWDAVRDAEIKSEYAAALAKVKMFPVAFSLLAARNG